MVYVYIALTVIIGTVGSLGMFYLARTDHDGGTSEYVAGFAVIAVAIAAIVIMANATSPNRDGNAISASGGNDTQIPYCEMCGKAADHLDAEYCWNCGSELN